MLSVVQMNWEVEITSKRKINNNTKFKVYNTIDQAK